MPTDKKNKIFEFIEKYSVVICTIAVIIILGIIIYIERDGLPLGITNRGGEGSLLATTTSTMGVTSYTDLPMVSGAAILHSIGIGQAGGGQVAIFDSITDTTDESIVFFTTASSAQMWQLDLQFDYGIMVNTTDQAYIQLFYTPK